MMTSPISINQGVNSHQSHAFLYDDLRDVKKTFERRIDITNSDNNLIIKNIEEKTDRTVYEISRRNIRNDMDSDEYYRLTLFHAREIKSEEAGDVIIIKPERYSWFAEAGHVYRKGQEEPENRLGTLMMVNPDNVKLIQPGGVRAFVYSIFPSTSDESDEAIHQLLEILSTTARQPHLYEKYSIEGLPTLAKGNDANPLLCQWPLLEDIGERYVDRKPAEHETLAGVVNDMICLVKTLIAMHDQGVVHGDVKAGGIRVIDGKVGPGNPERFSVPDEEAGPDKLGEKRFIYYNNGYHAPELRFPGTLGSNDSEFKPWQYTSMTKQGDIWSLGILLAQVICCIPGGREQLKASGTLQLSLSESMKAGDLYNGEALDTARMRPKACKFLKNEETLLDLNTPDSRWLPGLRTMSLSEADKEKVSHLVALVAKCTHIDPEQRPSAEQVLEALGKIQ